MSNTLISNTLCHVLFILQLVANSEYSPTTGLRNLPGVEVDVSALTTVLQDFTVQVFSNSDNIEEEVFNYIKLLPDERKEQLTRFQFIYSGIS